MTKYAMKAYIIFEADDDDDASDTALMISEAEGEKFTYSEIQSDTKAFELGNESAESIFEARRIAEKMRWV